VIGRGQPYIYLEGCGSRQSMLLGKCPLLHSEERNLKKMASDHGRTLPRTATGPRFLRTEPRFDRSSSNDLAGLDGQQTVGEQFTQERLAKLGAEFNLADSDWGQLYCMIRCLKE
jgi:hypothetical protein